MSVIIEKILELWHIYTNYNLILHSYQSEQSLVKIWMNLIELSKKKLDIKEFIQYDSTLSTKICKIILWF